MKAQTPADKLAKIGEFDDMVGYRTVCECTSERHSVDTWIELEGENDGLDAITVTFHINTYTHPFAQGFWQRVKNAAKVLMGCDQQAHDIILTKQQALNWVKAVETTIKKMDEEVSAKSAAEKKLLCYVERPEGFYPKYDNLKVTKAFIKCQYCNSTISNHGGPCNDAVCISCYELDPDLRGTPTYEDTE